MVKLFITSEANFKTQGPRKTQMAVLSNCKDNYPEELKLSLTLDFLDDSVYPLIVYIAHERKIGSDFRLKLSYQLQISVLT